MKSAVLLAPRQMVIKETEKPKCPDGGLLVRTRACSICSADARMYRSGHRALTYPRILGHEIAGEIVENGSANCDFKSGQRVQVFPGLCCGSCPYCKRGRDNLCEDIAIIGFTVDGGFSEYLSVPAQSISCGGINPIPDGISYEEASLAEPLASCLNGQELTGLDEGDTALVIGAGPIGLLHAMLSRSLGARKLLIADRITHRLEAAGKAGADCVIDAGKNDIERIVRSETRGNGVDAIFIASSAVNPAPLLKLLRPRGRLCLFSGWEENVQIPWDHNLIHYRELGIIGAYGSTAAQNKAALELIHADKVPVSWLISEKFSLDELPKGLDYVDKKLGLKAVIVP